MKKYLLIVTILCISFFYSCKDEEEYGVALVYMPQATHNLGTDCNLYVNLSSTDQANVFVTLGIYRSGLQKLEEVTVDIVINTDTIPKAQQAAQDPDAPSQLDIYKTGVMLPSQYYEPLPGTLTIPAGSREATTSLVLKKDLLYSSYSLGDILLLPVEIKNPTFYELNHSLSLTMVVITLGE